MSTFPPPSLLPRDPSPPVAASNGPLPAPPSNSQIEAVIQMATSAASSSDSRAPGRDTRTQLFVGNLPYRVRWQDLKDLFRKAGTVLRADVSLGPDNRSRGFGTVLLATPEDAAHAVEMFNGYNWQTRTLDVRLDRLFPDFDSSGHIPASNTNSLPSPSAGPAFPIPIMHSIPFAASPPIHSAVPIDDFEVSKLFAGERSRAGSGAGSRTLFVGNLPFHCQWQDLKDLFRQAGTVVRADVALGPDGRSRGYGTVSFANDGDSERALNIFNGYEYNGRTLKVHYDKYSQGQPSQSPTPLPAPPTTSPPHLHHAHPSAPTHIPIPPPPPLAAYEHFASNQPPSPFENIFGQISPYDIFPPHIAAIAANATARAYMNNSSRSPPPAPVTPDPLAAVSISTASSILSQSDSTKFSPVPEPDAENKDTTPSAQTGPPHTQSQPPLPQHNHTHPAHPGPIALPSPPLVPFPHMPSSPLQGLPPITPSMPPFTFVPQNATPPLSAHFLSPGVGLSPFTPPSPGTYFQPPNQRHPLGQVWNVAPGAPVHVHPSPLGSGSPGFFAPETGAGDYFSVVPRPGEGYFSPAAVLRASGVTVSREMLEGTQTQRVEAQTQTEVEAQGVGKSRAPNRGDGEGKQSGGASEDEVSSARCALRTHSDGDRSTTSSTPAVPAKSGAEELSDEVGTGAVAVPPTERRASWTPQETRSEFRRSLLAP